MLHHHYNYRASNGMLLLGLGFVLGFPLFIWIGFFQILTTPMVIATATAAGGSLFLGLGASALALYSIIGIGYCISTASECYKADKGILDVFKSHFTHNDGATFTGVISKIGFVLWSPFLLLGGLSGTLARLIVSAYLSFGMKKASNDLQYPPSIHSKEMDIDARAEKPSESKKASYATLIPSLGINAERPQASASPKSEGKDIPFSQKSLYHESNSSSKEEKPEQSLSPSNH